jgi:hypothetical protein
MVPDCPAPRRAFVTVCITEATADKALGIVAK